MGSTTTPTTPPKDSLPNKVALHQNPAARQFVKFCIVGFSSTFINFGVVNILHDLHIRLLISLTAGFLLSCLNGFLWNRNWTFKHARGHSATTQSVRFVAVNLVGFFLNNSIVVLMISLYESHHGAAVGSQNILSMFIATATSHHKAVPKLLLNGSLAVATVVVVFWNYFANRFWTFKNTNHRHRQAH